MKMARSSRRHFIKTVASGAALAVAGSNQALAGILRTARPADDISVGIIGTGGRGSSLARSFAALDGTTVLYVCDPDERHRGESGGEVADAQSHIPERVADLRRVLDDDAVDAVVIVTPDHWHTPAALMAMDAGKDVYVEKPGSHNAREAELITEAAYRLGRVVQMGNQRRSWPRIIEAMDRIHEGAIGEVHYSRGWYANARGSIGHGQKTPVPEWLDFDLWQGPAPRTPYRDNILHYNWHWFWNWGTGEIGNNGVHALDLCRWGLQVGHPARVQSTGGRHFFEDDQETPDTHVVTFKFDEGKTISWEGLSSNRRGIDGQGFGASFHGEEGAVTIEGLGYSLFDRNGELIERVDGHDDFDIDVDHISNFIAAIRGEETLRSPIGEGQKASMLCHLGNISHRVNRSLRCRTDSGRIIDDAEAMGLWGRDYAPGWELGA